MGIVNSFVNQIGREMGRDAYRGVTSRNQTRNKVSLAESSISLLQDAKSFALLGNDEATLREITNLVERSENSDHEDFEWQELFYEIDNKIEFCKENLSQEFHPKLELLDQLNADNFQKVKIKHMEYIDRIILHLDTNIKQASKKSIPLAKLLSFIGLRAYYLDGKMTVSIYNIILLLLFVFVFYQGFVTYSDPISNAGNMHISRVEEIAKVSRMGISLMVCISLLYIFYLYFAFRKINRYSKPIEENKKSLDQFQKYLGELKK
jgi:hypothetical protein